ncbi:MAG: hypothetical protein KJ630_00645 [Proteobacteria bacterium]|nr:hypothetical protein [Pseudomonadota bacterium]
MANRLHFRTNSNTILPYLKSKADGNSGHACFSLNSIATLPKELILPLDDYIIQLSLLNIDIPILDETVKAKFLANWTAEYTGKQDQSDIFKKVAEIRDKLQVEKSLQPQLHVLEQAADNYQSKGFFSQFDWCMVHWGTSADILDVTNSTFLLPTACIEFQTAATPPIIALQQLANTFPSVLFTLLYQYPPENTWNEVQFYPFPPFGY